MELKYTKEYKDMEQACQNALDQIKDRRYQEYLLNDGRNDILLYGMLKFVVQELAALKGITPEEVIRITEEKKT